MISRIHSSGRITEHYSHGYGWLKRQDDSKPFFCNGCKTPGYGFRYHCNVDGCNADLHSCCAYFSPKISFFMHPHELTFMTHPADGWKIICNVCSEPIKGCFYGCLCLKFDAHPVCAHLPDTVDDSVHPGHTLTYLFPRDPTPCGGCGQACDEWRFRCSKGCKGVDFHLECLQGPGGGDVRVRAQADCAPERITSRSVNGQRGNSGAGRTKMDVVFALVTSIQTAVNLWELVSWIFELF